jgi:glyoxylase-like metal-dependent hydrolase (beta-lactamase superfamily II)
MATSPERLAPNVYRIDAVGVSDLINVFAVAGSDGWTLVDTGMGGSARRIQAALGALGVKPESLRRIYLTHQHSDHVGGLPGMHAWAPGAEIVASEHEAEVIAGRRPMDPPAGGVMRFLARWNQLTPVPVSRTVSEGEAVAGFRVVSTPGHSLGHTSLLSEQHGLLLTGDAFGAFRRRVRVGVFRAFCADPAMARRSADKLLEEEYGTVAFGHGRTLRDDPREVLRQAVATCRSDG